MAKALLLCPCFVRGSSEGMEVAFVQYMVFVQPLDAVSKALRCICLRWAVAEGGKNERETGICGEDSNYTVAGEWFGVILYSDYCACNSGDCCCVSVYSRAAVGWS